MSESREATVRRLWLLNMGLRPWLCDGCHERIYNRDIICWHARYEEPICERCLEAAMNDPDIEALLLAHGETALEWRRSRKKPDGRVGRSVVPRRMHGVTLRGR